MSCSSSTISSPLEPVSFSRGSCLLVTGECDILVTMLCSFCFGFLSTDLRTEGWVGLIADLRLCVLASETPWGAGEMPRVVFGWTTELSNSWQWSPLISIWSNENGTNYRSTYNTICVHEWHKEMVRESIRLKAIYLIHKSIYIKEHLMEFFCNWKGMSDTRRNLHQWFFAK